MATPFVAGSDPTSDLPDRGTFEQLANQWSTFLDQPGGRAALLSAGLQLMQPPSFGDNVASQVGRAVGAAGETAGRVEAMDLRQQEAASKGDLRLAQADAASARAANAGQGAEIARERLGLDREKLGLQQEDVNSKIALREAQVQATGIRAEASKLRGQAAAAKTDTDKAALELRARQLDIQAQDVESKATSRSERASIAADAVAARGANSKLQTQFKTSQEYNRYTNNVAKRNLENKLFGRPEEPVMDLPTFKQQMGFDQPVGPGVTSGAPRAGEQTLSPQEQELLDWANSNPSDPRAGQIKQRLQGKS